MPHFNPINKHSPLWCRPTYADRNCVIRTCNVMTDDGVTLFVYVTKYAAMRCKRQVWRALRLNPSASLIALSSRSVIFATEKRYCDKQIHHQRELNTEDDATKFLRHSRQPRFCPSPLQYTIYKLLTFHLVLSLHLDLYRSFRVPILKTKKVDLYKTLDCLFLYAIVNISSLTTYFKRKYEPLQSWNASFAISWPKLATLLLQPVTDCVVKMHTGSDKQIFTQLTTSAFTWTSFDDRTNPSITAYPPEHLSCCNKTKQGITHYGCFNLKRETHYS